MPNPQPSDIPTPLFAWAWEPLSVVAYVGQLRAMFPTPVPRQWVTR